MHVWLHFGVRETVRFLADRRLNSGLCLNLRRWISPNVERRANMLRVPAAWNLAKPVDPAINKASQNTWSDVASDVHID